MLFGGGVGLEGGVAVVVDVAPFAVFSYGCHAVAEAVAAAKHVA